MKITFDDNAKKILNKNLDASKSILLDLDDGVGMFSKQGFCSLNTSFRFLLVDNKIDFSNDYKIKISSNLGDVFVKESSDYFFEKDIRIKVKPNSNTLQMSNDAELIDGSVGIEIIN